MKKFRTFYLLISTIILGFFLRLYNLGKYGFWLDEVISIYYSRKIWKMIRHFSIDATPTFEPPLFGLLLHFWSFLGESEFILRLLSLSFGVLSIIAIYKVGQLLFNKKVGLISAFILAISPLSIYYSQELRPYSLVTFFVLMSIYNLIKSLENNRLRSWIGFIIFTVLCMYTHFATVFLLIIVNFFFLYRYFTDKKCKVLLKRWVITQLVIGGLYFLGIMGLLKKAIIWYAWPPEPSFALIIQSFMYFNMGFNASATVYYLAVLLFLPLFLSGAWFSCKQKKYKNSIWLLLLWLFIPITMIIIVSAAISPIYVDRIFLYSLPAYYILIAFGLYKIKKRPIYLCVLTLLIVLSSFSLKNYYQNIWPAVKFLKCWTHPGVMEKKKYKSAAKYIQDNFQREDVIAHTSDATYAPFLYYHNNELKENWVEPPDYKNKAAVKIQKAFSQTIPSLKLMRAYRVVNIEQAVKGRSRIWLVYSSWTLKNKMTESSIRVKSWLDQNYNLISRKDFYRITIYLYAILAEK